MQLLDDLIKQIAHFPGIGKKSATRIAYYLLKTPKEKNDRLAHLISTLQEKIVSCQLCGNYSEESICNICSNLKRDQKIVCVVEQAQDIFKIESTNEFNGIFHVLNGVLSPLDGIGTKELRLDKLFQRIQEKNITEVIIATNPTPEGDTTALFIANQLQNTNILISRIASGLPVGGDMEYADQLSIAYSMRSRLPMTSPKFE